MTFKSGFVTIVGRPNVGKSTLINSIVGQKILIMSDKPQTTRNKIQTIYNDENSQIIFLDTPGIHKPKNKLGEHMVKAAKDTLNEVDVIVFLVDESKNIGPGDRYILELLQDVKTPVILGINKIDKIEPDIFKGIYEEYSKYNVFDEIIGLSAINGKNVDVLIEKITDRLPEGPKYFPPDMITDQPERFIVSEIIREKLLHYLQDEVPHGVAVIVNFMRKRENKDIIDIDVTIYCERNSHKSIIIGKNGKKIKGVGKSARQEIENLLGSKVYMEIWVKVKKDWREKENILRNLGYE
ncbi:GTPase Era [Paramaledivibacter caminithermalis]|uniref:GTPase Era n=1 Tax=Paramaledivibacter caminithermalis (strain DSM 15212 / CIP 107654 / DViRD3) TaxID=1121301 RepID=A0A1M6M7N3_PARC5|nr:GTPase Era [Paramaledivibacter caminithermalis]SHJ79434.1 GTP-binding protein Era [Paramaledivibacter caminithermalis DSM 15212]